MKIQCAGGLKTPVSRAIRTEGSVRLRVNRSFTLLALLVALGLAIGCGGGTITGINIASPMFLDHPDCQTMDRVPLPVENLKFSFGDKEFQIAAEMAREAPQRTQGYMCRSEITAGSGMWFELPAESSRGFWMHNTYVLLDVIYFDATDVAVGAVTLPPCPRSTDESDNMWRSRCASESEQFSAVEYPHISVLELPTGWLASEGFDLSDAPENLIFHR
jgi:uncharacterized membrane protein (UPF0127 family)